MYCRGMGQVTTIGFDTANAIGAVLQRSQSVMPWYCSAPSFLSDRLESCIPSATQQVEIMRGNFGGHSDPTLVQQAVQDFGQELEQTGYDATVEELKTQDREAASMFGGIPWYLWLAGGLGVFALVAVSGSPRRYGR